jgi:Zn-dependent M16 (insulinase) family peptidase
MTKKFHKCDDGCKHPDEKPKVKKEVKPKQKDEWEDQYNTLLNLITIEAKTKRNSTAVNVLQKCLMDLENSEK